MPQYDNTNRGALFKNERKETDSHPDLSGSINIDGTEYWLSGWTKRNDDGTFKVLSLSVKPKERQGGGRGQGRRQDSSRGRSSPPPAQDDFSDDDIGF